MLTAEDEDWLEVEGNFRKARKSWVQMTRILIWEGVYLKVLGLLFKVVVQAVLLFGAETWFLTLPMEWALRSLQHRVM